MKDPEKLLDALIAAEILSHQLAGMPDARMQHERAEVICEYLHDLVVDELGVNKYLPRLRKDVAEAAGCDQYGRPLTTVGGKS